jgi:hypothetical protein
MPARVCRNYFQWARFAIRRARFVHQAPVFGPPLQLPFEKPGRSIHR